MKKNTYLIAGCGRLSKHFQHYFNLLDIPFSVWSRSEKICFEEKADKASRILILINDDAIVEFITHYKKGKLKKKIWIHCSGMLSTQLAESAHPLMTFSDKLYDEKTYREINFITEKNRLSFEELFPELDNKSFSISPELKPLYHAWCVMSGNFTSILWKEFFSVLQNKFSIPGEAAFPYLEKISENLIRDPDSALTGPFLRNDRNVINKHLSSLKDDEFFKIYESFFDLHRNKSGVD